VNDQCARQGSNEEARVKCVQSILEVRVLNPSDNVIRKQCEASRTGLHEIPVPGLPRTFKELQTSHKVAVVGKVRVQLIEAICVPLEDSSDACQAAKQGSRDT